MPRIRLALAFAAAVVLAATAAHAQTLTPVYQYSFPADGSDGSNPQDGVIQGSDGNIYLVSYNGGANGMGSIVKITPDGTGSLFFECDSAGAECSGINNLIQLPDGNFWGVSGGTGAAGTNEFGNIFSISLGGVITNHYYFANDEYGAYPVSNIVYVESCDCIYGATIGTNAVNASQNTVAYYGSVFAYKTGITGGTPGMLHYYDFGLVSDGLGVQPVAGVTVVNGNVYGTSQVGADTATQYGVLWYFNSTLSTGTALYTFANGADGAYPSAAPRYYKPDGNIYGTTLQNQDNQVDSGSIYKSGLTSGFTTLFTFTNTALNNFNGQPAFDTAGNVIVEAGKSGANSQGGLYLEPRAGGTPTTLFSYATGSQYGDRPQNEPFFDHSGNLWTTQLGGTANSLGSADEWTLSTETADPITISVTPTTVNENTNVTVKWSGNNLFSDNEQLCWATGDNAAFQGVQTGTYASGVYSGSKTFSSGSAAGTQVLTIECGGTESASVTLQVGGGSGPVATTTTVTASPNPVVVGNNVTIAATVKKSSGTGEPTGSVVFKTGTTTLATIAVNGSGVASFMAPTTGFAAGNYPITATYSGDANDDASSGSVTLTVSNSGGPVATTTTFSPTPNPVTVGNNIDLDVTVKRSSGSGSASGTVTFKSGTTVLATGTLGANGTLDYRVSTAGFAPGNYPVTATYNGDANDKASTSSTVTIVVTQVTTTTALTASSTSVKIGTKVTLTATVTPAMGTTTGKVNFMTGTTLLASVTLTGDKAVLTAPTTGYPPGMYAVRAVYGGSTNDAGSTSNTVTITLHN
jgi:hypothetical protein